MNGRVYLPELGVFLSPDPFLQFPESTQGYNRYAYVSNNPLSYTDPSGHFIQFLKAALFIYNMFQSYQAGGFSGLIKGFLLNAISAGMANSIGGAFGDMAIANFKQGITSAVQLTASQVAQKAVLHGITQGLLSAAGGGRFRDGFLGGAAGSLAEHMRLSKNNNVRTIQTIVIGGTVSRLGGGKFASGAVSAAFVDLYNRNGHLDGQDDFSRGGDTYSDGYEETSKGRIEVTERRTGAGFAYDPNTGVTEGLGPRVSTPGLISISAELAEGMRLTNVELSAGYTNGYLGLWGYTDGKWVGLRTRLCPMSLWVGTSMAVDPAAATRNTFRAFERRPSMASGRLRFVSDIMRHLQPEQGP